MACLIYGLIDPRTRLIRYVGKSRVGLRRAQMHKYDPRYGSTKNTHCARWIARLERAGLAYDFVILETATPEQVDDLERYWIAFGRACGWPLTNLTEGGEGFDSASAGHANAARWKDPKAREKIQRENPMYRADLRAKASDSARRQWADPEMAARMRAAMRGKPHRRSR